MHRIVQACRLFVPRAPSTRVGCGLYRAVRSGRAQAPGALMEGLAALTGAITKGDATQFAIAMDMLMVDRRQVPQAKLKLRSALDRVGVLLDIHASPVFLAGRQGCARRMCL